MSEGRQKSHTIHTVLSHLLQIQVLDDLSRGSKVIGIKELKIRTVLHTQITVFDQPRIDCNSAAGTLAEHMVKANNRDNTAFDDLLQDSSGTYRR